MVHNHSLTSTVSAVSVEISESLQQTLPTPRLSTLGRISVLPTTWRSFLLLLAALTCISAGLLLYITLAVQTFQMQAQINELARQAQLIERANTEIVWAIAQHTALDNVRERALALGYEIPLERHYVTLAPTTVPDANAPAATVAEGMVPASSLVNPDASASNAGLWEQVKQFIQPLANWWQP